MKKKILNITLLTGLLASWATMASAASITYTFSDLDFLSGASWGTMTVSTMDADTLQVQYDADSSIPSDSQATAFGFNFDVDLDSVSDPASDANPLTWAKLTNLNAIPNPSNGDEFFPGLTKDDFTSGATEGTANNITPPGILPGQSDIFYLNFSGTAFTCSTFSLADFINSTGVRLQALPDDINEGSLFLAGKDPVPSPEPATMLLLGTGLAGLAASSRRKRKA